MNLDAMEEYRNYLQYQSISIHTRRNYFQRVKSFLQRLDGSPDGALALTDPSALNIQLRDYKAYLLARGASASTVNCVLSARLLMSRFSSSPSSSSWLNGGSSIRMIFLISIPWLIAKLSTHTVR